MRKIAIILITIFAISALLPLIALAAPATSVQVNPAPIPTPAPTTPPGPSPQDISFWQGVFTNPLGELPGKVVDLLYNAMANIMKKMIGNAILTNINFYMEQFVNFIKDGDRVFHDATVNSIYSVVKPVAYSLIALFFIIGLSKNAIYFEVVSWEVILKAGMMLVVGKYLIDFGITILKAICDINTYLCNAVLSVGYTNVSYDFNGVFESSTSTLDNAQDLLATESLCFIFALIALLCAVAVFIVLIMRQIQLGVLVCVAPLFLATLVADVTNDVFKSYIKNFVAVAFQTTFMSVALCIFAGSIRSYLSGTAVGISGGFIGMLVGIIGLSVYIIKTPNSINNMLGVNSGGGGLSVAAIGALFI